jgi:hypothetical protein
LSLNLAQSETIFFLGAGASVPAGVHDVRALLDDFIYWLTSNSKLQESEIISKIKDRIEQWLLQQNTDRAVDIELLLETLEKLENADDDILLDFYQDKKFILNNLKGTNLSTDLKYFIRTKCFVSKEKTVYLAPFQDFINTYKVLNIFSTNYDNSIEQYCEEKEIRYIEGFDSNGWNSKVFEELDEGVKLYKLHGSITWRRTEDGDYKLLPIVDPGEKVTLSSGRVGVPLILYPRKKLEYSEPIFDILQEVKNKFKLAKYIFVIGYAFKDIHITRLFQYAAKKNRKAIIFLVSPSAFDIYEKKLRYLEDKEFPKSFSAAKFTTTSFSRPLASKIVGRVICLPYKIETVFPLLKDRYLQNLIESEKLDFIGPEDTRWTDQIKLYLNCEHIEKVEEILENNVGWDKLGQVNWRVSFEFSLKGLLIRTFSTNEKIARWKKIFNELMQHLSFDRLVFVPTLGMQTQSFPPHIELEFHMTGENIVARVLADFLKETFIPITEEKIRLVGNEVRSRNLTEFLNRVRLFIEYLQLWVGDKMTFETYYRIRADNYPEEIEALKIGVGNLKARPNDEMQRRVKEIVEQIEGIEIQKLYEGETLGYVF